MERIGIGRAFTQALTKSFELMDSNPAIPIGMATVLVLLALVGRNKRRQRAKGTQIRGVSGGAPRRSSGSMLDKPLLYWSQLDPWTIRRALESLLILGRSGSGKT